MYGIIIIGLIVIAIILMFIIIYLPKNKLYIDTQHNNTLMTTDLQTVQDTIANDSYLHRLMMVEIMNNSDNSGSGNMLKSYVHDYSISAKPISDNCSPDKITYLKMVDGMVAFGVALIRTFGETISQRITTLFHKRNEIIRNYYKQLKSTNLKYISNLSNAPSVANQLSKKQQFDEKIEKYVSTDTPDNIFNNDNSSMMTNVLNNLGRLNDDIVDNISGLFQIRISKAKKTTIAQCVYGNNEHIGSGGLNTSSNMDEHNNALIHYKRLRSVMNMYDKELLNQAKAYAIGEYTYSMNCAKSTTELSYNIGKEFNALMTLLNSS